MKKCPASPWSGTHKSKPHWGITSCLQEGLYQNDKKYQALAWMQRKGRLSVLLCVCPVTQSCLTLRGPVDCNPPGPSVHGTSRQEYWSKLPLPSPGDVPDPGFEPVSLVSLASVMGSSPLAPSGKPRTLFVGMKTGGATLQENSLEGL